MTSLQKMPWKGSSILVVDFRLLSTTFFCFFFQIKDLVDYLLPSKPIEIAREKGEALKENNMIILTKKSSQNKKKNKPPKQNEQTKNKKTKQKQNKKRNKT